MVPKLVRFLLVEDDNDHAEIIQRTMQQHRINNVMERVVDGVEALAYVRGEGEYAGRERPDVMLLDLKLPRMDGHQVLEVVKSDPDLASIAVVVLTTSSAETDRAKAYERHANSYLVKPVDYTRFQQLVNDLSLYWGIWNSFPRQ